MARPFIRFLIVISIFSLPVSGCQRVARVQGVPLAAAGTAQWAMEGGHPDRGRHSPETIVPPLAVDSVYSVGGDTQFASPVTIAHHRVLAEGARKLHVLAVDGGQEEWQINLAGTYLSPAVDGDTVFVRVESGEDGYLVALGLEDGAKLWEFKFPEVGSVYDNIGGHVTSPIVVDNTVLAGAGGTLFALEAPSGRLVWQVELAAPIASSAAVTGGMVFVTDFTQLYAIDLASGAEQWRFDHREVTLQFAPIIVDDHILITSRNIVFMLDRHAGEVVWSREFDDVALVPAAASPDRLYVKSPNRLLALAVDDGTTVWEYSADNFVSLPALTTNYAYVVTRAEGGSQLRAIGITDGDEVWRSDNPLFSNAAPVIAGGRVYVRTVDGQILAYQPAKE